MANLNDLNDLSQDYLKTNTKKASPSRPTKQNLSEIQTNNLNKRLKILLPQWKTVINERSLAKARNVLSDLQPVLRSLNKITKLVEVKNQFFELALEENEYDLAIDGFLSNRVLVNDNTRLYIEATALLAISYLRKKELEKAKPFIKEVLQSKNVIKTESTRDKFNREIIARFDEECALYSLTSDKKIEADVDALHKDVTKLEDQFTSDQLYSLIGKALPKLTKDLLFEVDNFSKKQLPYAEQKLLPSPEEIVKDEQAGRTIFSSFKRVLYKSLCDPTSEVYKIWYKNAVGAVVDRKFITAAVGTSLIGVGVGTTSLIVVAAALVLRFGLDIYCDRYRPSGITELRRKSV